MKGRISPALALWLLITLTMVIFIGISFSDDISIGKHTLSKARFKETLMAQDKQPKEEEIQDLPLTDTIPTEEEIVIEPDTTVHNVLVFGDSMSHHLAMSIAKYGSVNNYKVTGVSWESSSTVGWSKSGKLRHYLDMTKPDFVIISLGSNEMNLKNFDNRVTYMEDIVKQLDTIPYVWVGPPLWKKDPGLYDVIAKAVPADRFFKTGELTMERGKDNIHPTKKGADTWADTLMLWIKNSSHPILAEKPDTGVSIKKHKFIYLHPED